RSQPCAAVRALRSFPTRRSSDLAAKSAQDAVFAVHRYGVNLREGSATAAEASVRAARASAGVEGVDPEIPDEGEVSDPVLAGALDRKSTRLNSSHVKISYAVFCL